MNLPSQISERAGGILLGIARRHLAAALESASALRVGADPDPAELAEAPLLEQGASFVTLEKAGELRGCMGSLYPIRPLVDDVRTNALNAALRDPRFPPMTAGELSAVSLEVTVLSLPEPIVFGSEEEAIAALRPYRDGVVLIFEQRRSTLLPQVWDSLLTAHRFLACLKQKAGLPADFWHRAVRLERYDARTFHEVGPQAASSKDSL